jgi:hypothetical protein
LCQSRWDGYRGIIVLHGDGGLPVDAVRGKLGHYRAKINHEIVNMLIATGRVFGHRFAEDSFHLRTGWISNVIERGFPPGDLHHSGH